MMSSRMASLAFPTWKPAAKFNPMPRESFSFGPFVLDSERSSLRKNGLPIALGRRAMALLTVLAEAGGAAVSKDLLIERAWDGQAVEENNLTVQIAALRRAMAQDGDRREWIATVPRLGYRLALGDAANEEKPPSPGQPALAVVPFEGLGSATNADLSDSLTDEIIAALSHFRHFTVFARSSSFALRGKGFDARQTARELGAAYLIEGSVRGSGQRLRVTAQIVSGEDGTQLWTRTFDGSVDETFDFQDTVARAVAAAAGPLVQKAELERSRRERPASNAPYDVFLRALPKILAESEQSNSEALALLTEALDRDPDNPQLLAHATWALEHRTTMGWPPHGADDRERCVAFARRGLQFAAGDASVMAHCGIALVQVGREYDFGRAVLSTAAAANPNSIVAVVAAGVAELHCGSLDQALANFHRAIELSPSDPIAHIALCGVAHVLLIRQDDESAIEWALRSLAANQAFDPALWMLTAANAHLGRIEAAQSFLARLRQVAPGVTVARILDGQPAKDPERLRRVAEGLRAAGLE
jgi:TolB-like protein/Tfp pilus assembly protein PilF